MAKGGGLSRGRVGNRILSLYPARFYCRAGLSGIGSAGLIPSFCPLQLQILALSKFGSRHNGSLWGK